MADNGNSQSSDSVSTTSDEYEVVGKVSQPKLKIANDGDLRQLKLSMDEVLKTDVNISEKFQAKFVPGCETNIECDKTTKVDMSESSRSVEGRGLTRNRALTEGMDPEDVQVGVDVKTEHRDTRSFSLPQPLQIPVSPKKVTLTSTVFDCTTYLGCAAIDAPRSEVEVARIMNILSREQVLDQAMKISLSVPRDCDGSVILTDPDSSSEIASFKIHQIIFCCRGKQDSQEASCFAYTCSHGKTVETSIFQCHVFDCHSPEHVGNVLLSFASAFSRVTSRNTSTLDSNELNKNMNMSTPMLMKSSDEMYVFEVFLEIREDDYRGGYIAVPWDKSYFKLRCDVDKKLSLVVQQVGGSERLFIEKCFGLLLCPGRNVKHSDMQLLELSSMGTSNESDRMYVISGGWDPTDPIYEVLNTETPKDTKVFFTVAVDLVIRGIEEPVRFSLETKAKIFPRTERFWYFSKKFMQEKFQMKLRRVFSTGTQLNDLTSDKFKFEVFNVESESDMERKRKVLTLNLTAAGARAAVQSVQTPADADTDSDRDEPLLSGSGVVSKDCSEGELEGWADVLSKWRQNLRQRPKQLSSLVRKGIPEALRGEVWQLLARCDEDSKDMMEMYRILITKESSCESTIMRDIHRTFPAHEFFRENGGLGQDSLYKISKAYSVYDEEVGYCQGLSFLAAALVLHMPEEQAFCLQVKIMFQYQLRDLFKQGFDELHLKFYQLERLLEDQLPELYDHFVELGIEAHMYGSQWFLTLYTAKFPLCLVYFILDLFLLEGTDTIFRVALALLLMSKEDLLALDFEGILKYFRVSLPKKYRTEESAKQLVNSAVKIKVKKLKKYEKEYAIIKEQENLQQDPVERLEKENRRMMDANMRLEQENDDLAHELVTSKIQLRNNLDSVEDKAEILAKELKSSKKVLNDTEEEKKRLVVESVKVKEMFHREMQRVENENSRNSAIINEYKQICNQLSDRLEKEQKESKNATRDLKVVIDSCESCSKRLGEAESGNSVIRKLSREMSKEKVESEADVNMDKRIRELELELAQTKLALVEAECKNQDSSHQLNAALAEIQSSKNNWFHKTLSSIKEVTKQKDQSSGSIANIVND